MTEVASRKSASALVVGGGLLGCSIARRLALRGLSVVVVEAARPAGGASWAAAGMLSPLAETADALPLESLAIESFVRYPGFVKDLEEASGIRVEFRTDGKTEVARSSQRAAHLRHLYTRWLGHPHVSQWLDGPHLAHREAALSDQFLCGLHFPGDAHVDNRQLGEAAWRAAEGAGVHFTLGRPVQGITARAHGAALRLSDGTALEADHVVLAAGAWSGRLAPVPRRVPVRPVRGQMLALRGPRVPISGMIHTESVYLIPRAERVLVGATMEEAGFDASLSEAASKTLLAGAVEAVPELASFAIDEQWAGLRPGTPDGLPVIGRDPDHPSLIYATGHFRNGILLAPVTAALVEALVVGDTLPAPIDAFLPDRFG